MKKQNKIIEGVSNTAGTLIVQPDPEITVGQEVWWIPGYRLGGLLAIRCHVTEIDDQFRKKTPDAYLFYWIDEPVGHALAYDDFYFSQEDAIEELKARADDLWAYQEEQELLERNVVLEECREDTLKFVYGTWVRCGDITEEQIPELAKENLAKYPAKIAGVDWFNLNHVGWNPNV